MTMEMMMNTIAPRNAVGWEQSRIRREFIIARLGSPRLATTQLFVAARLQESSKEQQIVLWALSRDTNHALEFVIVLIYQIALFHLHLVLLLFIIALQHCNTKKNQYCF